MAYVDLAAAKAAYLTEMEARITNKDFTIATETDLIISGVLLQKYEAARLLDTSVFYTPLEIVLFGTGVYFDVELANAPQYAKFIATIGDGNALGAILEDTSAMAVIAASSTAMAAVAASSTAMAAVAASSTAMAAVAASSVGSNAIFNHSVATYTRFMCSPHTQTAFNYKPFRDALANKFVPHSSSYWLLPIDTNVASHVTLVTRMKNTTTSYDLFSIYSSLLDTASASVNTTVVQQTSNSATAVTFGPYALTAGHKSLMFNLENQGSALAYPANYETTNYFILYQSISSYGRIFDNIQFTAR
jgi:hypothetical protein